MIRRLLLALALIAAPLCEASATILFAGGEDIDTTFVGAVSITTTAGQFRAGYGRAALSVIGSNSPSDPPAVRFQTPTFANQGTIWVHAEHIASATTSSTAQQSVRIFGSDGNPAILVRGTGTAGQVKISTRNTAGTITDLVTCTNGAWPLAALNKIDISLVYAVSGSVTMYANGTSICTFSGDVTTNSRTLVNQVEFAGNGSASTTTSWSELIVATTDTRNMNLVTLAPVANGNTMAWSGVVGSVNPTTISDASNINTGSNSQIAEFTVGSLPAGLFQVLGVAQKARIQVGTSGPLNFEFVQRPGSGGTDYVGCSTAGTTSFANYACYMATNPAGGAWVTGDFGAGTNFGVESLP